MIRLSKIIATVFGIGFLPKGGGTAASALYCLVWTIFPHRFFSLELLLILFVVTIGIWSASKVEAVWGVDSSKVVIDEVAGMMIALLFVPIKIRYVITALVLFRFFDILKPLGIKRMEKFPSGWGVMADDVLSGIYALVIMQTVITLKLF
ncbi:MAG: phosphatidylglycerophosphatase A [Ginsengibacter sp.]